MRLKFKDDKPQAAQDPNAKVTVSGIARCGHSDNKDGPAKFRAGMLQNIAAHDCRACRQAKAQAEKVAAVERRKLPKPLKHPRLPSGARFEVVFNANLMVNERGPGAWTGTLTVGNVVVECVKYGLVALLASLDKMYREEASRNTERSTDDTTA